MSWTYSCPVYHQDIAAGPDTDLCAIVLAVR